MAGGQAIRGSRVGSGPMGEDERGVAAPRRPVTYYCNQRHATTISISTEAEPPAQWDCPRCGLPGSADEENPPETPRNVPYKTHLAYAKERRSDDEATSILDEALATLRDKRKRGEVF